ncbi:hypothetical protein PMI3145 [Proteus mirabilis HI4320]|uniref:Uncharacterized protein n=1 Tax=Proteus mirabilis (strain HI4320) TaxID=529507 RepID=B4F0V8_PROMH|nr:hypothetical protein PMI3145 [Proteus mirabilis HI4320]
MLLNHVVNDHAKLHQIRKERSCKNDPPDSSATFLVFARDNLECFVWKPTITKVYESLDFG